jgi:hypothetical protein
VNVDTAQKCPRRNTALFMPKRVAKHIIIVFKNILGQRYKKTEISAQN